MIRSATSPIRTRPAAIIGLPVSAPPDGFTSTPSASPSASRRISSSWLNWAWISATSIAPEVAPAFSAASFADGAVARSRNPRCWGSTRCSMPRIHAGRSQYCFATSSAAITIAAAPSVIGAMSLSRSGRWVTGRPSRSSTLTSSATTACGLLCAFRRLRAATSARSPSVLPDAVRYASACSAAMSTIDGHSVATVYGSVCSVQVSCRSPSDALPNP